LFKSRRIKRNISCQEISQRKQVANIDYMIEKAPPNRLIRTPISINCAALLTKKLEPKSSCIVNIPLTTGTLLNGDR